MYWKIYICDHFQFLQNPYGARVKHTPRPVYNKNMFVTSQMGRLIWIKAKEKQRLWSSFWVLVPFVLHCPLQVSITLLLRNSWSLPSLNSFHSLLFQTNLFNVYKSICDTFLNWEGLWLLLLAHIHSTTATGVWQKLKKSLCFRGITFARGEREVCIEISLFRCVCEEEKRG